MILDILYSLQSGNLNTLVKNYFRVECKRIKKEGELTRYIYIFIYLR